MPLSWTDVMVLTLVDRIAPSFLVLNLVFGPRARAGLSLVKGCQRRIYQVLVRPLVQRYLRIMRFPSYFFCPGLQGPRRWIGLPTVILVFPRL